MSSKNTQNLKNHNENWTTEETAKLVVILHTAKRQSNTTQLKKGVIDLVVTAFERTKPAIYERHRLYKKGEIDNLKKINECITKINDYLRSIVDFPTNMISSMPIEDVIDKVMKFDAGTHTLAAGHSNTIYTPTTKTIPTTKMVKPEEEETYLIRLISGSTITKQETITTKHRNEAEALAEQYWKLRKFTTDQVDVHKIIKLNVKFEVIAEITE